MNVYEFYKYYFGVEPKLKNTTINESVLRFAETYAKHKQHDILDKFVKHLNKNNDPVEYENIINKYLNNKKDKV